MLCLRQVCLAAPALAPVVDAVHAVFGLDVAHRDPNVAPYGLENAIFVVGHQFLEVVAPVVPGTAAGRFIDRSGGRGGYIAIFDADDPEARRDAAAAAGVGVVNALAHPGYRGWQLHPRACRGAMLEFDHTDGAHDLDGPYAPAGPHWQRFRRADRAGAIRSIELESPAPAGLAQHWSRITGVPVGADRDGAPLLRFDVGAARFVAVAEAQPERLTAIDIVVAEPPAVLAAAARRGLERDGAGFRLAGVTLRPVAAR